MSSTSIGSTATLPPLALTASTVASASSTEMYVDQAGGCPSCISLITPPTGCSRSSAER